MHKLHAMRRWLRPLWVVLALLFLLEAWLWDHLEPIVARVVNLIPWGKLKVRLARLIEDLPPWAALVVFVIPFIVLLPLKFLGVYFLAHAAIGSAPIGCPDPGQAARPRRHRLHLRCDARQAVADGVVPPDVRLVHVGCAIGRTSRPSRSAQRMQQLTWLLKPQRAGRFLRRLMRLRRRAYRSRAA